MILKYYYRKAYTMILFLLSLWIISLALLLYLPFVTKIEKSIYKVDPQKILSKMRFQQILAQSTIKEVSSKQIKAYYQQEEVLFVLEKKRIVKKPGYHILMVDVDGEFEVHQSCIWIQEIQLYCEKGLH